MRLYELTQTDEGWKSNLAVAGAVAAGGIAYKNLSSGTNEPDPKVVHKAVPAEKTKHVYTGSINVLKSAAESAGITGKELCHLLAQSSVETLNFSRMTEFGPKSYFVNQYDISSNPRKAKILGNTKKGDGVKYRGRGFLHLTGRFNYRLAGEALGLPLEQHPELVEQPEIAAKTAIWYWNTRVKPKLGSNIENVDTVTKAINPGAPERDKQHRSDLYAKFKAIEIGT